MRFLSCKAVAPFLLATALGLWPATAGIDQAALALAGPLAEQFGVPAGAVTQLLEGGVSLESVTQLLLVSQSSGKSLGDVNGLYEKSDSDIGKTAEPLEVPASAYSDDAVTVDHRTLEAIAGLDPEHLRKEIDTQMLGPGVAGSALSCSM